MLEINLNGLKTSGIILQSDISLDIPTAWTLLEKKGLSRDDFYFTQNGRLLHDEKPLAGSVTLIPRLLGGKGGFGSMLRAIGAQIEKTTNRDACRDLSGRRLRDINEEKRLKAWIEKQATKEDDAAERKKKKVARLRAEPKHEFNDKNYEHERSILTERVDDAVAQGFQMAAAQQQQQQTQVKKQGVKRKTILDDDIDSDELDSSDDESVAGGCSKKLATVDHSSESNSEQQGGSSDDNCPLENQESSTIKPEQQISNAISAQ